MTESQTRKLMLLDACVLIDYWKARKSILESFSAHLDKLHIASPVLEEVEDINDPVELTNLGVNIVTPELEDLIEAGAERGQLSFQDRLCILVAKRAGFTCVTNDKSLRNACETAGVGVIWGLEIMLVLYHEGGIERSTALDIAWKIMEINPKHITNKIVRAFKTKLQKRKCDK